MTTLYTPEFYIDCLPELEFKDPQFILSPIKNIYNALKNQKEKQFLREIFKGVHLWSIGLKKEKVIESKLKTIQENFFSNTNLKVIDFKLKDIRIVWGERSALVYSGFRKIINFAEPYLFKCNIAGKILYYPPVYFVYVNKKWIIWN